jgi:hypothetical protein
VKIHQYLHSTGCACERSASTEVRVKTRQKLHSQFMPESKEDMNVGMKTDRYDDSESTAANSVTDKCTGACEVIPSVETELAISAARFRKKQELDARFAEIIAMIHETCRKNVR